MSSGETAQEASARLVAALEETQRSSAERAKVLNDLGHEIRTPLNGIVSMVDLLAATTMTEQQTSYAATIREASARLTEAADKILDMARLQQHFSDLQRQAGEVADALQAAVTQSEAAATECPADEESEPAAAAAPAPANPVAEDPVAEDPVAEDPVAEDPADPGSLNILVAEDNTTNQLVVRSLLERMGHSCTVVENGRLAVDEVQAATYDLILMDCMMPELDGFGATREIRQLDAPVSDIPILALTANAMKGDRERCLDAGMTEYMAKPVRLDILTDMLARFGTKAIAA